MTGALKIFFFPPEKTKLNRPARFPHSHSAKDDSEIVFEEFFLLQLIVTPILPTIVKLPNKCTLFGSHCLLSLELAEFYLVPHLSDRRNFRFFLPIVIGRMQQLVRLVRVGLAKELAIRLLNHRVIV